MATLDVFRPAFKGDKHSVGGAFTLVAVVAFLVAVGVTIHAGLHPVLVQSTEVAWSSAKKNFPLKLRCQAPGGCLVAQLYTGLTAQSRACALAAGAVGTTSEGYACEKLEPGEMREFSLCYSTLPQDGLLVLHHGGNSSELGTQGLPVKDFGVVSESDMLSAEDGSSVPMEDPIHRGHNLMAYVRTRNSSQAAQGVRFKQERHEWFSLSINENGLFADASTCNNAARVAPNAEAPLVVTRMVLKPNYVEVSVEEVTDWLALGGQLGGYGSMIFSTFSVLVNIVLVVVYQQHITENSAQGLRNSIVRINAKSSSVGIIEVGGLPLQK